MRRTLAILCFLAGIFLSPLAVRGQGIEGAQQEFVNAFLSVRKGEGQESAGELKAALATFRSAANTLARIKKESPNWQPELVEFRLKKTMEAMDRIQTKMGGPATGAGANDPGVLPPLDFGDPLKGDGNVNPPPARPPKGKSGKTTAAPSVPASGDPLDAVKDRISALETQLADANDKLRDEQQKNATLSKDIGDAMTARKKAEDAKKKAQDLAEIVQKSVLDLKAKGDANSDKVKELEVKLAAVNRAKVDTQVDLAAAEERISQLIGRSREMQKIASEAGTLPAQVKTLQAKLDAEQKASAEKAIHAREREDALKGQIATLTKEQSNSATMPVELKQLQAKLDNEQKLAAAEAAKAQRREEDLKGQIASLTVERNDAQHEIARLRGLNKETDKLMTDNASLLKKLGEAEKQILAFKTDTGSRDTDIAALRKQIVDAQKGLATSTEKNTVLQKDIGELQKKVADYKKQIDQFKSDKTASLEERQKMESENKLLQGIVMRVLQEDANRAQKKKMIQSEISRLHIQSSALLDQINYFTQPVVKLSNAERKLFKKPVFDVQDPSTLVYILPSAGAPSEGATVPAVTPDGAATTAPPPENPATKPLELVKLDTPPTTVRPKPSDDLPVKDPVETKSGATGATPGVASVAGAKLPADVKPIAEQAKQAFEREKFTESERLYDKALQLAPNNVYLYSNRAVVQFRMGKFKQAEESLKKALAIAPEDSFGWALDGIVKYSEEKYDDAVNSLTKSLAINPKNPTAHNYLGITAAQKGWIEAAQKELETAIQLDPKYADAWFNLAVTHTLKDPKNLEDARKSYAKAIELGAAKDDPMEAQLK